MSMNATFIQVDAAELARLEADPGLAEGLFESRPLIPPVFANLNRTMQDRVRAAGPNLMAQTLSRMDPAMRQRLEQHLGVTTEALASGAGGEHLLKAMQDRGARLAALSASATAAHERLSLDKAWHGVHYVLCGLVEPGASLESQAVLGGENLGEDDEGFSGYGPARYFTPAQVAELSQALSRPELEAEAAARFDAARMSELEIYPGWDTRLGKSDADWVMDAFRRLRAFYAEAASKGRAMVTCLV
jgi:hypothetical protein